MKYSIKMDAEDPRTTVEIDTWKTGEVLDLARSNLLDGCDQQEIIIARRGYRDQRVVIHRQLDGMTWMQASEMADAIQAITPSGTMRIRQQEGIEGIIVDAPWSIELEYKNAAVGTIDLHVITRHEPEKVVALLRAENKKRKVRADEVRRRQEAWAEICRG